MAKPDPINWEQNLWDDLSLRGYQEEECHRVPPKFPFYPSDVRAALHEITNLRAAAGAAAAVIRDICDHCGWNVHSPTCREIDCPIEPWLPTAPPHNYIGEEAVGGAQEITARLEKSMSKSPIRTNPEAAREFLAGLSMYDENGQLRKGAPCDEPQEVQDAEND